MPSQRKQPDNPPRQLLQLQEHELIMRHALDPDNTPLTPRQAEQFNRIVQAARLFDQYPDYQHVLQLMKQKYDVSVGQLRKDIALARELFKTQHTFDYDFWHAWEIKDQIELIRRCREKDDYKNWNAAKKHLRDIIGDKPPVIDDPRRMERNIFYIQVNSGTAAQPLSIPLEQLRSLSPSDRQLLLQAVSEPITADSADNIFDT